VRRKLKCLEDEIDSSNKDWEESYPPENKNEESEKE
jgi:hypothetical protein